MDFFFFGGDGIICGMGLFFTNLWYGHNLWYGAEHEFDI